MKIRTGNFRNVYLPVLAAAVVVRIWCFLALLGSPLRRFECVPGLDMQTLLVYGQWFGGGREVFSVYRALIALIWHLNGRCHFPELLVLLEMAGGCAVALLTARLAMVLWGKRPFALAAGLLAAFYGPALLYESVILQESTILLLTLLAVMALLRAWRLRFAGWSGVWFGLLLGLAVVGRPVGLLLLPGAMAAVVWSLRRRGVFSVRMILKRFWQAPVALAVVLLGATLFNFAFDRRNIGPFFNVTAYLVSVNASQSTQESSPQAEEPAPVVRKSLPEKTAAMLRRLAGIGVRAVGRMPSLFSSLEIPENLNYYFIRERMLPLRLLPGPALLLPLALGGFALMVCSGRCLRREGLTVAVILLLAIPLCVVNPIGRYRLLLYPYLVILAVYPFWWALGRGGDRELRRHRCILAALAVTAAFGIHFFWSGRPYLRSTDFVSWGIAMEARDGRPTAESVQEFAEAYLFSGGTNRSALVNLLVRLIPAGDLERAEWFTRDALERGKIDPNLVCYYYGLIRLGQGRPAEAETFLRRSDPAELGPLGGKVLFFLGEARRMQKDREGALELYRAALKLNELPGFRSAIEQAIRRCEAVQ